MAAGGRGRNPRRSSVDDGTPEETPETGAEEISRRSQSFRYRKFPAMSLSRTSPRRMLAAQRKERAIDLRINKRWSSRRIADELGISHTAVLKYLRSELEASSKANAQKIEHMRMEETLALDRMQEAIWAQAVQEVDLLMPGDEELPRTSRGNIDMGALVAMIQHGTDNRINAINTILKISKRRAMLHGLDMPQRRILEGTFSVEGEVNVRHQLMERFEEIANRKRAAELEAKGAPVIEAEVVE